MSSRMPPLDDVVSPMGAAHARALQQRVADFITGGADQGEAGFNQLARDVFRCQFKFNEVYRRWCAHLGWTAEAADEVQRWQDIPTLPVEAFRWSRLHTKGVAEAEAPLVFRTSGTTGADRGEHHVATPGLYRVSAVAGFKDTYGAPGASGAVLFGLLPGYLERPDSSLVHMVRMLRSAGWSEAGGTPDGGFFLDDLDGLFRAMEGARSSGRPVVLIGVTWALVDAAAAWKNAGNAPLGDAAHIVVTGGMKGRREEWVAERVREAIRTGFGCAQVGGEYGMTELLSQAWSTAGGVYRPPHWMRVRFRRTDDPLSLMDFGATGGLDIVDLANLGSCALLSTQDLARPVPTGSKEELAFELLGRFDRAEVRGCNLLVQ